MPSRHAPAPSPAFDAVARDAQFRDRVAVRVRASPEAVFHALRTLTLKDMKRAWLLGEARYLPARLIGRHPPGNPTQPFLSVLEQGGTLVLHDAASRELILGSAGRLHRVMDQTPVRFISTKAFEAFAEPDYEKLFISVRIDPTRRPGEFWLVLEHATQALSPSAERLFRPYWRLIRPMGAFVSRELLRAVRRKAHRAMAHEPDALLDRFMPQWDVVERHHVRVGAPAEATFAAARDMDLWRSAVIRAIFRARELLLGGTPGTTRHRSLLAETKALGWGVLAEHPGRAIVMGAVTKPWEADVVFRALPPDEFAAFREPGFVKIAWTLRADAVGAYGSIFRTETRAAATDPAARARFRRYWRFARPGIVLIRWLTLRPLKAEAERRAGADPSAYLGSQRAT